MAFKAVFIAHAPDAVPERHRCVLETSKYVLFVVLVRSVEQAIDECKRLVREEGIHSVLLCPGFTNTDVADIADAVGEGVGVGVARMDGPSNAVVLEVMKREGWWE